MKSHAVRLAGLLVLWWFSDLLACLFSCFLLYHLGLSVYNIYRANTSDREDHLQVDREKDVIVVSGCDSGIGQAAANKLAESFHVIATVIDVESPAAVALKLLGVNVIPMDLTSDASIKEAVGKIEADLNGKKLHGIVNNAGVCIMGELDWMDFKQIDQIMKVNLSGPILFTKLLLPRIIADKSRVVNVTGMDGISGASGLAVYCSSKFGMEGFTDSLRLELAKFGVRVITLRPGDYSSLTTANSQQAKHLQNMWDSMEAPKREKYSAELDAYSKAVTNLSGALSAANFDGIRATFERIMTTENPENEYNEGSNLNIIAHRILSILPKPCSGKLRSKVVDHLVKVHLYRPV